MTDRPSPLTLAHLNLDVADLTRSERFYLDVLELPVTRRSDSLLIRWAGSIITLTEGDVTSQGTFHFGFRAPNHAAVDAWFVRLTALSVPILEQPVERGAVYVGRIEDPDGYAIEIYAESTEV